MVGSPLSYGSARRFPTEESNANSIPGSPFPVQSQVGASDEEDTPSMRELVRVIDDHAENVDLEVTSNLNAANDAQSQIPPIGDALG